LLKAVTNIPCPKDLILFGGDYPYVTLFREFPANLVQPERTIRCYPAGHASGAFALMSLGLLFNSSRNRRIAAISAFVLAWIVGIYKMGMGDHFLSHTIVTMLIAFLFILLLDRFIH
jgi:membrane-associated PAP2 superfamily phosphatase